MTTPANPPESYFRKGFGLGADVQATLDADYSGRIVDLLARKAKVVARYSAVNNAGHTIVNERGEFKLNLVPATDIHLPGGDTVPAAEP